MKTIVLLVTLVTLLTLAVGSAVVLWLELDGVEIGTHGLIALGLGIGVSLALGVGLMRLVYWSNKRGFDD